MLAVTLARLIPLNKLSRTTTLLLILAFLECIGGGIAYYLALYLSTATSLSKLQIGQVGSATGIGALLGALCSIYLTDRFNKRNIIIYSLLCLSISFFCLAIYLTFYKILAFSFLLGISTNIFMATNNILILQNSEQSPEKLRYVQSLKGVCENIGTSASMILIMFFAAQNYGQIFQGVGLFFLLLSFTTMKYLTIINKPPEAAQQFNNIKFKSKYQFVSAISALFIVGMIYAQQRVAYPLFLQEKYNSFAITAALFWLDPIIVSVFQVYTTKLFTPIKIHNQLAIGGLLLGLGLFMLIAATSIIVTILACIIFIIGEMIFMPNSFIYCYESVGLQHKGMASGAWRSAYSLGLIIGPIISGFLMEYYNYNYCWMFSGILGLLIFMIFYYLNFKNNY